MAVSPISTRQQRSLPKGKSPTAWKPCIFRRPRSPRSTTPSCSVSPSSSGISRSCSSFLRFSARLSSSRSSLRLRFRSSLRASISAWISLELPGWPTRRCSRSSRPELEELEGRLASSRSKRRSSVAVPAFVAAMMRSASPVVCSLILLVTSLRAALAACLFFSRCANRSSRSLRFSSTSSSVSARPRLVRCCAISQLRF